MTEPQDDTPDWETPSSPRRAAPTTVASDGRQDWHDWTGGKCPVPEGTPVDVRFRDGQELHGAEAQISVVDRPRDAAYAFWNRDGNRNDIVAWRLAK